MEGEGRLLKEASLPLQTSPTLRELPPKAPALAERRFVLLCSGRVLLGEVLGWFGRWRFFAACVYRTRLVGEVHLEVMPYTSAEIPPAGAPSGFDSAAIVGLCVRRCIVMPLRSE